MQAFAVPVIQQRRFKLLLLMLVSLSLLLGLIVVPVERNDPRTKMHTWFDGVWWSAVTVTGVGYGDVVPVTVPGRIIGIILAAVGVLSFGLVIAMFSIALEDTKDRYYRLKMFEQLDDIQQRLDRLEKGETYLLKKEIDKNS